MGLSIAQMALLGGADDAGSTMMEENVVSASGTDKMQATEIELQDAIIRAGFVPRRRNSRYELLDTPDAKIQFVGNACTSAYSICVVIHQPYIGSNFPSTTIGILWHIFLSVE